MNCQSIQGFDANPLYLWSINQDMPMEIILDYREMCMSSNPRYITMFYRMEFVSIQENIHIRPNSTLVMIRELDHSLLMDMNRRTIMYMR